MSNLNPKFEPEKCNEWLRLLNSDKYDEMTQAHAWELGRLARSKGRGIKSNPWGGWQKEHPLDLWQKGRREQKLSHNRNIYLKIARAAHQKEMAWTRGYLGLLLANPPQLKGDTPPEYFGRMKRKYTPKKRKTGGRESDLFAPAELKGQG
jgi:hypothetical protein